MDEWGGNRTSSFQQQVIRSNIQLMESSTHLPKIRLQQAIICQHATTSKQLMRPLYQHFSNCLFSKLSFSSGRSVSSHIEAFFFFSFFSHSHTCICYILNFMNEFWMDRKAPWYYMYTWMRSWSIFQKEMLVMLFMGSSRDHWAAGSPQEIVQEV